MNKEELESLVSEGLSNREIADKLGKNHSTVRYWLNKYGLKTKHPCCMNGEVYGHQCSCGETDPLKFHDTNKRVCKKCRHRKTRNRMRESKKFAIKYKGGQCRLCGYNRSVRALHFHHRDPSQKDPLWRSFRSFTQERICSMLDACELVCANCHSEIHDGFHPQMFDKEQK